MDLPNLFSAKSDKDGQLVVIFIHLTEIKIQSFLLAISDEGIEILEKSKISDYKGAGNCLIKVDESLQQLGKKSESIDSVIFGLNNAWVKKGGVVKEKKPLLKKLTDELSLKPLGFIVVSEAIVQQRISRNSMFSGIVTVLTKENLTLSLVHQGKIKAVESVGRSSDGKGDFLEGLARFSAKSEKEGFHLPARIILASMDLNETELRKHQQLIYDSDWKAQSQFLQPPTVEVVLQKEYEEMITKEAAKAVALQKGMTEAAMMATVSKKKDESEDEDREINKGTKLNSNELGFSDVEVSKDKAAPTSFGIPISTKEFDKELISSKDRNLKEPDFEEDSELAIDFSEPGDKKKKGALKGILSLGKDKKKDGDKSSNLRGKKSTKKTKHYKNFKLYILVGFITGLVALIVIAFFGISASASADVTIGLKTQSVSKDLEITLDTSIKETDIENLILRANKVSKTKQSESTMQTTGVKIVGDKARGRIKIYNDTIAEKLFSKGTVLKAGELQFELSDDVKVASQSSPKPGTTVAGEADVDVVALQIGADSNITEDTELAVLPFDRSSYYAFVIDEDFIGGASREVKVVSEDDRLELILDLRKELIEEISKEFEEESEDGVYILPSNKIISETQEFSFEVGNEAEELSLILEIELEAITYTAEDLKPIAAKVLDSEIPDNYRLSDDDPQILSAPTERDLDVLDIEKPVTLSANISSFAIPDISIDSLKNDIAGKAIDEAKSMLESRDEVELVSVVLNPSIARSFVKKIPSKLEKISIIFKSE